MERDTETLRGLATKTEIVTSRLNVFKGTRKRERFYPWVLAVLVGLGTSLLVYVFDFHVTQSMLVRALGSSVIFGSITAGFIGTNLAVLSGMNKKLKTQLAQSKYIYDFRDYFRSALYSGFTLALLGIVGPIAVELGVQKVVAVLWFTVLVFCIVSLYRVYRQMFVVFTDPDTH